MTNETSSTSSPQSAQTQTKICNTCETEQPVTNFYKRKQGSKDGYQYQCKDCQRNRQTSGDTDPLTPEQKAYVYPKVIMRMYESGIMSKETAMEALERVS